MSTYEFHTAYARIQLVTNTRTQVELADILGIRQSSISDAKRRGEIPASWMITLLKAYSVSPEWIVTGEGPQYLAGTDEQPVDATRINWYALGQGIEDIQKRAHDEIITMVRAATQPESHP